MNRNDYHLLEEAKDYDDFWTNWELEDVPHTDYQKGDILVKVWKNDKLNKEIPRDAFVFMEDLPDPEGDPWRLCCANLDDLRLRHVPAIALRENWTYKRVKESDLFFKENITDRVAIDERFPLDKGDLIDVRLGNGKWSLALFLGLNEGWLEEGEGPTYSIYLCGKTIREAMGEQFSSCRANVINPPSPFDFETKIIRVQGQDYYRQKWATTDLWNAKDLCYDVRWRKK